MSLQYYDDTTGQLVEQVDLGGVAQESSIQALVTQMARVQQTAEKINRYNRLPLEGYQQITKKIEGNYNSPVVIIDISGEGYVLGAFSTLVPTGSNNLALKVTVDDKVVYNIQCVHVPYVSTFGQHLLGFAAKTTTFSYSNYEVVMGVPCNGSCAYYPGVNPIGTETVETRDYAVNTNGVLNSTMAILSAPIAFDKGLKVEVVGGGIYGSGNSIPLTTCISYWLKTGGGN